MEKKTIYIRMSYCLMIFLWASAFPGIRAGLEDYAPQHLTLLRLLSGSAALVVMAAAIRMRLPHAKDIPIILLLGFLGFSAYHTLLNLGEETVSAGMASLLVATTPIFSALLARLFFAERFGAAKWIGSCISFLGVGLISLGTGNFAHSAASILFILLAAISESLYFVFQERHIKKYGFIPFVTYTIWGGTIPMLFFLPGMAEELGNASIQSTASVVYLGLLPTVVPYFALAYITSRVGAAEAAVSLYLTPALTLIISWIWFGEVPAFFSLLGGMVTIAGVLFTYRKTPA
ncbi:EamA family transporter [Bacillus swezeyi]|uniref:EamA family transporter n=1 Tax=Bacillus swezeyi TaxID=1925020 RepID=A0A1R1QZM8_9BACI|nr:EamA family transporter [Bacillus swezeyi]MEC1259775.1 EamA family transporter [Bacillus swezeyi]MED2930113.1 EamA family transporter [Bacillus swezeyi]MED2944824.1 EamA family transporter [Bacillus swezeyi]MED2962998.1 EamA family transporter [Bacillus swezeyi]MED2976297.1 EamA family transporter [Bacillus swezeyi]